MRQLFLHFEWRFWCTLWSLCSWFNLLSLNLEPLVAALSPPSPGTGLIYLITFEGLIPATAVQTEQMSELLSIICLFLRVDTTHQHMHKYIGHAAADVFHFAQRQRGRGWKSQRRAEESFCCNFFLLTCWRSVVMGETLNIIAMVQQHQLDLPHK